MQITFKNIDEYVKLNKTRIQAALPSPLAGPPTPDFPDYPQQLDDGNRR